MSNNRIEKKRMQKVYMHQIHDMRGLIQRQEAALTQTAERIGQLEETIARQEELLGRQQELTETLLQQSGRQQNILNLFYREYQELKTHSEKQYLMTDIRMRESFLKDIKLYEEKERTNSYAYQLLKIYVNDYTDLLEEQGVEILEGRINDPFDPTIAKPIERVDVQRPEYHNIICKIYSCGYRWRGIMLKKMDVAVGIFNQI